MDGFTVSNANRFLETGQLKVNDAIGGINSPGKGTADPVSGKSFADTLKDAVKDVNEMQKTSDKAMQNLATGRTDNVADVMVTAEKAEIALRLMIQVRNKIIDAYQDIMKMQV